MPRAPYVTTAARDDTEADRGYDLADRFAALKLTMRRVEFQGHLETAKLRDAVLPRSTRRSVKRRRATRAGLQAAAGET